MGTTVIDAAWTFDDMNTAQNGRFLFGGFFTPLGGSSAANVAWRDGVLPSPFAAGANQGFRVYQNTPTGVSVKVGQGHAIITRTGQGVYLCTNSQERTVTLTAADPTNSRIDLIVLRVRDTGIGDGSTQVTLESVDGTPSGSPVAPATPAGAIVLARVVVAPPPNDAVLTADITDFRRAASLSGTIRRLLAGDSEADVGSVAGELRDTGAGIDRWNGSVWTRIARPGQGAGYVADIVPATNRNLTGTEVMSDTITFNAISGYRYRFDFSSRFSLNANGVVVLDMRIAAGASVTTASTAIRETITSGSGANNMCDCNKTWTAPSTGQFTVGIGAYAAAGAATGVLNGDANTLERQFTVTELGS